MRTYPLAKYEPYEPCNCLHTDAPDIRHAFSCPGAPVGAELDNTMLRSLAELAAGKDIDAALYMFRQLGGESVR
jgi:hypothetical protein